MAIANRHIRKDWQTWVEWNQKTSRSLCEKKTLPRLSGIPGVTACDILDWCAVCCDVFLHDIKKWKDDVDQMPNHIKSLYNEAAGIAYMRATAPKGT